MLSEVIQYFRSGTRFDHSDAIRTMKIVREETDEKGRVIGGSLSATLVDGRTRKILHYKNTRLVD